MSVASEITRIQNAKSALKTSIENKGVTVSDSTLLSGYSALVDQIQTGGGGGQAEEDLKNLIERDITTLNIPDGVTTIRDYTFYYCDMLEEVTIPEGVTSIGKSAFCRCSSLEEVTIPNSVTNIGKYAFEYCDGLTSITIPSSVTSIGDDAFYYCSGLTSVTINATTPPTLSNKRVFYNTNNCPIYCPAESLEAYKTATNWKNYADRIQAIPSE